MKGDCADDGRGRRRWPSTPTMAEHNDDGEHANNGRGRQRRAIALTMGAAADEWR